jgi:nitrogen-specific signal transduction histidine kinase
MKTDTVFALEHAAWPTLLIDNATTICRANESAKKLFGPALDGASPLLSTIWSPENGQTPEQFLAHWERSPAPLSTLKYRGKGGHSAALPTSICAFTRDGTKFFVLQMLTETGQASDGGSAHKQKLDCALQLARTVALDFNNALTSILGHTSLVLSKLEPNHPLRRSLIEVEKSASRAAEIANDLGMFSRQEKEARPQQASGNLNQLVQRSIEIFQRQEGAGRITWGLQLERQLFAAKFDEAKMQQALAKILENAMEAVTNQGTPRITIQTANIELNSPAQDRNVQLAAGTHVCIEIADNGCGITSEVLPRVFEPFFTTKRDHRGLGLAWVYGIVTNHGGGVCVSSEPGAGASVRIYLPAERRIVSDASLSGQDLRGTETILFVDDEDLMLTLGQTVLSAYGFRVLTANSGKKAVEILSKPESRVDLVITDLVMPAMSGRELIEQIQLISPGLRVLRMSGYVSSSSQQDEEAYLQKPFTSQDLVLKVKQALAARQSS